MVAAAAAVEARLQYVVVAAVLVGTMQAYREDRQYTQIHPPSVWTKVGATHIHPVQQRLQQQQQTQQCRRVDQSQLVSPHCTWYRLIRIRTAWSFPKKQKLVAVASAKHFLSKVYCDELLNIFRRRWQFGLIHRIDGGASQDQNTVSASIGICIHIYLCIQVSE